MLFLLTILSTSAPTGVYAPLYTRVTAANFSSILWNSVTNGTSAANLPLNTYTSILPNLTYVVRSRGEKLSGWNYTYYYVYGTPAEIAALNATLTPLYNGSALVDPLVHNENNTAFVILQTEASDSQTMLFWANIVVWLLFLGFVAASLIVWHTDNYAKDPANSLLFVTDGNRIVTGE
jgi:hypothetical protein